MIHLVTTPLASPNIPSSPSPYYSSSQASLISANKHRDTPSIRRTPPTQPIVSNILRALEPPNVETIPHSNRSASEDGYSTVGVPFREPGEYGERREKKGFWAWDRNKDHDKDRGRDLQRREDEMTAELTKMIGSAFRLSHIYIIFLIWLYRISDCHCIRRLGACIRCLPSCICQREQRKRGCKGSQTRVQVRHLARLAFQSLMNSLGMVNLLDSCQPRAYVFSEA